MLVGDEHLKTARSVSILGNTSPMSAWDIRRLDILSHGENICFSTKSFKASFCNFKYEGAHNGVLHTLDYDVSLNLALPDLFPLPLGENLPLLT